MTSARVAVNIGENGNGNNPSGEIATSTTVYGAIGDWPLRWGTCLRSRLDDGLTGSYSGPEVLFEEEISPKPVSG